jgi:hypothetical protein
VPYNPDPQVLQILHRQIQQDGIVGLVLAESRLILTKAQASEPHSDIDGSRPCWSWLMIVQAPIDP